MHFIIGVIALIMFVAGVFNAAHRDWLAAIILIVGAIVLASWFGVIAIG